MKFFVTISFAFFSPYRYISWQIRLITPYSANLQKRFLQLLIFRYGRGSAVF